MTLESWRAVVGYEGLYEVSDLGRVRGLDRQVRERRRTGVIIRHVAGRVRRLNKTVDGHMVVQLSKLGEQQRYFVHALILAAFVGPRPAGMESLHRDGNGTNNVPANLRWGTHSENVQDALRHGSHVSHPGSKNGRAILTEADIPTIRERLKSEFPAAIARDYGVNRSTIQQIKRGQNWSHIGSANDNHVQHEAA